MKKKYHGHTNLERYLVTYSDLITLLLAFFIILYAMSTPDAAKTEALAEQLSIEFHPNVQSITPPLNSSNAPQKKYRQIVTPQEQKMMQSVSEQNNLRKVKEQIDKEVQANSLGDQVQTNLTNQGLQIVLTSDILFDSGSADLKNPQCIQLLQQIGDILVTINNPISIQGHTDNVPIHNSQYPSNWELSAGRALSVLRTMVSGNPQLDPTRFSATGYGQFKPIADNSTDGGKQKNRRVEILVERQYSDGLLTPGGGGTN